VSCIHRTLCKIERRENSTQKQSAQIHMNLRSQKLHTGNLVGVRPSWKLFGPSSFRVVWDRLQTTPKVKSISAITLSHVSFLSFTSIKYKSVQMGRSNVEVTMSNHSCLWTVEHSVCLPEKEDHDEDEYDPYTVHLEFVSRMCRGWTEVSQMVKKQSQWQWVRENLLSLSLSSLVLSVWCGCPDLHQYKYGGSYLHMLNLSE
jgi:hypothetical protein